MSRILSFWKQLRAAHSVIVVSGFKPTSQLPPGPTEVYKVRPGKRKKRITAGFGENIIRGSACSVDRHVDGRSEVFLKFDLSSCIGESYKL
jgi:hypothetical protein